MTISIENLQFNTLTGDAFPAPITTELAPGTVTGIVGGSGAGKTLFLRLLAGELHPSAGRIIGAPDGREIAWIQQHNALAYTLTAFENVALPMCALGVGGREAEERARRALDDVGLTESADHLIEELSGGQQQRVAVARALAAPAALLIADEPTSALDAGNRRRVHRLLDDRARAGTTVVLTSSDPEAVGHLDHVVQLPITSGPVADI